MAAYQLNDLEKAYRIFEGIIQSQRSKKGMAIWYAALIDLEKGQLKDCRKKLQLILDNYPSITPAAKALLNKLKNIN